GDGLFDCADGDCVTTVTCQLEADHCGDLLDNDQDGLMDCEDVDDCATSPLCDEALHCTDTLDNDYDGKADCADDACSGHPHCDESLQCADQADNDLDTLYDCGDPDCAGSAPCTETGAECDDMYDNDLDDALDCDDPDCEGSPACLEVGHCWDGLDNDDNGDTDCLDAACSDTEHCAGRARLTEISFDGGGHGTVEIGNPGVGQVTAALAWVCVDATCVQVPEYQAPLEAGGTLALHSSAGEDVGGHSYLDAPWGMNTAAGSARLYGATSAEGTPTWLLDYVSWGAPGQVGEADAVAAGRWEAEVTVPTGTLTDGRSLGRYGVTHEPWRWTVWNQPTVEEGGQEACHEDLCQETWCADGRDNDHDGARDCDDPDCADDDACTETGQCDDAQDNDADGAIDCYDTDCAASTDCAMAARFTELMIDDATGGLTVELLNPFSANLTLAGAKLCSSPTSCYTLPPGVTLNGGKSLVIHAGSGGGPEATLLAGDSLGDISLDGGVLTLTDGGDPDDPDAVVAFVDWGRHGNTLHVAAADAGLWPLGDRIETAGYVSGHDSLVSDGSAPGAAGWSIATSPTLGETNPGCGAPGSCRECRCFDGLDDDGDDAIDCHDPDCEQVVGCAARIVIHEVYFGDGTADYPSWIELANLGGVAAPLEGVQLCEGGATCYEFDEGELAPDSFVVLTLAEG
ncbi:MAG: hypothetical protein QF464_11580, partial [Myxococcota bacterium]|nr:hypothetical protein [Myxococcota bacterium]